MQTELQRIDKQSGYCYIHEKFCGNAELQHLIDLGYLDIGVARHYYGIEPVSEQADLCDYCNTWVATHKNGDYNVCDKPKCQDHIQALIDFDHAMEHPYGDWADVPFWFAWLCWSMFVALPVTSAIGWLAITFMGFLVWQTCVAALLWALVIGAFVAEYARSRHGQSETTPIKETEPETEEWTTWRTDDYVPLNHISRMPKSRHTHHQFTFKFTFTHKRKEVND